jgi:hypothetical protein
MKNVPTLAANTTPHASRPVRNTAAKPAHLSPAITLCNELIMKEDNGFAVANLLETKLGSKALLHDVQSRPLQPSEKIGRRRQYSGRPHLVAMQRTFPDVLDLLVGKTDRNRRRRIAARQAPKIPLPTPLR